MINKTQPKISGFTLVELSIVIIIIGLILSSVINGTSLVGSSASKAMLSEVQKFRVSIGQFQSLYKYLPGDMPNATSYWSTTANGDSNGKVASETSDEPFRAIEQLYLANLIDGAYIGFTGVWGSGFVLADDITTGNVLGLKSITTAGMYLKCCSNNDYSRTLNFKNHIAVFAVNSSPSKRDGTLTPVEAFEIDKKIDDGVPDTGLIGASGSWNVTVYAATGCYSGTGSASTYDTAVLANKNYKNCQILFAYDTY